MTYKIINLGRDELLALRIYPPYQCKSSRIQQTLFEDKSYSRSQNNSNPRDIRKTILTLEVRMNNIERANSFIGTTLNILCLGTHIK
jgi:hypothetical protein